MQLIMNMFRFCFTRIAVIIQQYVCLILYISINWKLIWGLWLYLKLCPFSEGILRSLDFFCNLKSYKKWKLLMIIHYTGITFFPRNSLSCRCLETGKKIFLWPSLSLWLLLEMGCHSRSICVLTTWYILNPPSCL